MRRDKLNVFYYPEFWVDYPTLIKSILLFDEIHFMDRPSMMFGAGRGQFGTIGAQSPFRQFEKSFRDQGVPLFVHGAPGGPVHGRWFAQVQADVNDLKFLKRLQDGLKTSPTFRGQQVARGNYGEFGDQDAVVKRLIDVDLNAALANHKNPMALFEDADVRHFDLSNAAGCAKNLISVAATCSAKLNFALDVGARESFIPLADARPYGDLLGSKYARATNTLESKNNRIQATDLSFAIFDEVLSKERLKSLTIEKAISYRKDSASARETFLEHISVLQAKQASIGKDGDYAGSIDKIIATEILPVARAFKNKLKTIDDGLFATIIKGAVTAAGGPALLQFFGDLSWPHLITAAAPGAAIVANAAIDSIVAGRAAKRECSVSYVLSLDD